MYWINDKSSGPCTITGKANREVIVHGIDGYKITVTITLGCGAVVDGDMNLIEFIDMMEKAPSSL